MNEGFKVHRLKSGDVIANKMFSRNFKEKKDLIFQF